MKNAKDIPALKAVSQNLMHSNLNITDGMYGILSDMDVKKQIAELGLKINSLENSDTDALISLITRLEKLLSKTDNNT